MLQTTANQKLIIASIALLIMSCGGCQHQKGSVRLHPNSPCCWQIVDSECYGYYPTCWRTWPEACEMCMPPEGKLPETGRSVNAPLADSPRHIQSEEIIPSAPLAPEDGMPVLRESLPQDSPAEPDRMPPPVRLEPFHAPSPPVLQDPQTSYSPDSLPPYSVQARNWGTVLKTLKVQDDRAAIQYR
jgi:hypothetical protein